MRRLAYRTAVCDNRSMKAVLPCKLQACLASLWVALCGLAAEPARVIFDFAAPLDTSRLTLQVRVPNRWKPKAGECCA